MSGFQLGLKRFGLSTNRNNYLQILIQRYRELDAFLLLPSLEICIIPRKKDSIQVLLYGVRDFEAVHAP